MMQIPRCTEHPRRPAVAKCPECGKRFCSECSMGMQCEDCAPWLITLKMPEEKQR
jgi:hypothetical protein